MACGEEVLPLDGTSPVPWQTSQHRWIAGNLFGTTGFGLEHGFYFSILGIIIPTDYIVFFRGVETTNQSIEEEPGMSYAGCWNMSSLTQATRWRFRNLILKLLVRSCGGSWRSPMGHRSQGLNPSQTKKMCHIMFLLCLFMMVCNFGGPDKFVTFPHLFFSCSWNKRTKWTESKTWMLNYACKCFACVDESMGMFTFFFLTCQIGVFRFTRVACLVFLFAPGVPKTVDPQTPSKSLQISVLIQLVQLTTHVRYACTSVYFRLEALSIC